LLNQTANAAVKGQGSIFEIIYRRCVPRLGHNQAIGVNRASTVSTFDLVDLASGNPLEETGPAVTKQSRQSAQRQSSETAKLGYRIEPPNPQPSQAQAQ